MYPSTYVKDKYYEDWKETILEYRKRLIKNLNQGKDYKTNKGIIRIVPIKSNGRDLSIEGSMTRISADTLRFDRYGYVPKEYLKILGEFGFTFIEGNNVNDRGWVEFEVVAYFNLG